MWIDSHSHIWPPGAPERAGDPRGPSSFTPEELLATVRPEGVTRVVLIQHSIIFRFDNSYLLDAVRQNPAAFRAVGMVDDHATAPGAEMRRLLPLGVAGFRITPFIRKDNPIAWLDSPGMHEMWATAAETRQTMCCLIDPHHLPQVDAMCERYSDTPVVIDHLGRIGADGVIHESDVESLRALARHANAHVKVSGFYVLGAKQPPYLDLVPFIRRVYDTFGPHRLMWGSDSPYQFQGGHAYGASLALVRDRLDFLSAEDRESLLCRTAERVFFA
jgi:predicted TIM-barrel fold metal-dependent hydrolase